MKKLIKLAAAACVLVVLYACSSSGPGMSQQDSADYGPPPTAAQVREGVRALGGNVSSLESAEDHDIERRLTRGWATDLDNPGSYIFGWQLRFQQDAVYGGGTVTALFHDGILIAATRETASQAKPERIK
jgi:hypothetical protein